MSDENDKNKKRERFGRYLLLDHLVDGGMAQICRARFLGEQADKVVAIKMVQPQFSKDDSFKQMFMDEINTTFGLIHPNIVQTYDYGLHNEQLFVAMEYCDGRNLKEYLDKLRQRKFVFPVEISVFIISQVCQGLHYAHTFTDKLTGKKSNIIHRDISPHNIMLTYDGAVKIIDFGIAKSETNSEATQAGTIKGKLSYLAPEYLEGHQLDPRYDEFAVGITLWEMLCSKKLFKASNDLAVLKKIQECKVPPPSSINPNVPAELDEIVLKALAKDRNERFADLDQFNRVLMRFLYSHYPEFNATDLSYFAKELFKEEIKVDREKLFEFGKIDLAPYLEDLRNEQSGGVKKPTEVKEESTPVKNNAQVFDFGFDDTTTDVDSGAKKPQSTQKIEIAKEGNKPRGKLEVGSPPEKLPKQTGEKDSLSKTITRTSKGKVTDRTLARTRTRTRNSPKSAKKSPLKGIIAAMVAGLAIFMYIDKGDRNVDPNNEGVESRRPSSSIGDKKPTKEEKSKFLNVVLKNFDRHSQKVFVNSKEVEADFIGMIRLPIGKTVILRVETPNKEHFVTKLFLNADSDKSIEIPSTAKARFGFLVSSSDCASGRIYIDNIFGENRIEQLPLSSRGIPLPIKGATDGRSPASADYIIYYQKEGQSLKREVKFNLLEDSKVDICDYVK